MEKHLLDEIYLLISAIRQNYWIANAKSEGRKKKNIYNAAELRPK